MSKKIIGVTVGTTLPKPNFNQTDPTKGDYIRNKPDFDGLKDRVDTVSGLVGDTAVSEQINKAIENIEIPDQIYVQDEEPTDAEEGALWLDTDEEGYVGGITVIQGLPDYTAEDEGKVLRIVNGVPAWVTIPNAEDGVF